MIIDRGSSLNITLQELVDKLNLKRDKHLNPFWVAWVNDTFILVSFRCLVTFFFGRNFEESVWCEVLPLKVSHILLGRPWLLIEGFNMTTMQIHIPSCIMGVRRSFVQWKKSRQLRSQMRHNQKKVFTMRQFEKESMKNKGFFLL